MMSCSRAFLDLKILAPGCFFFDIVHQLPYFRIPAPDQNNPPIFKIKNQKPGLF
jgi:hypothetical protein